MNVNTEAMLAHAEGVMASHHERQLARLVCRKVLLAVRELPLEKRAEQGDWLLQKALLEQTFAFKERLTKQCKAVLLEGMAAVQKGEA